MIGAVEITPPLTYKETGKYYQRFDGVQFGRRQADSGDTIDFYSKQNGIKRFHIYKSGR